MEQNQYKRKYREMDDATKQKISDSLRNRSKSASHRTAISDGLKNYWQESAAKPDKDPDGEI